jgi:nicotinamidase-related amidase
MNRTDFEVAWRPAPPDFLGRLAPGRFALIVVDMQYFFAHPDHGVCAALKRAGRERATRYFTGAVAGATPNIGRVISAARAAGGEVIFTRLVSASRDGRERSYYHGYVGSHVAPATRGARIVHGIGYRDGDIVLSKVANGSFYGTPLEYVLRTLGVESLLLCGVTTDGCVEGTVREAADRGYQPILVADACAAWSRRSHDAALWSMGTRYDVRNTADVVRRLREIATASPAAVRSTGRADTARASGRRRAARSRRDVGPRAGNRRGGGGEAAS